MKFSSGIVLVIPLLTSAPGLTIDLGESANEYLSKAQSTNTAVTVQHEPEFTVDDLLRGEGN